MLIIGSHVSFNKETQLLGSLKEALGYGENTFMFYTGAPQNTNRCSINDGLTLEALTLMKSNNIDYSKVIVHAPYIINLANRKEEDKFNFSIRFLTEEVERCDKLGIKYMVLHPGSHVGCGIDTGIENIINGLNTILDNISFEDNNVIILLETMAGKGTEVGSNFNEIKRIINGVNNKNRIGVSFFVLIYLQISNPVPSGNWTSSKNKSNSLSFINVIASFLLLAVITLYSSFLNMYFKLSIIQESSSTTKIFIWSSLHITIPSYLYLLCE